MSQFKGVVKGKNRDFPPQNAGPVEAQLLTGGVSLFRRPLFLFRPV